MVNSTVLGRHNFEFFFVYYNPFVRQDQGGEEEQDEQELEEDYIDSDDEREEGEKAPHENAFVYIDNSGKLVYVEPEDDDNDKSDQDGEQGGGGVLEEDAGEEKQPDGGGGNLSDKVKAGKTMYMNLKVAPKQEEIPSWIITYN